MKIEESTSSNTDSFAGCWLDDFCLRSKLLRGQKVDDCELGIQRIDQSIALLTDKYIAQSINDNAYQITLDRYQKEKAVLFEKLKLMNSAIYDEAAETAKSIIELSKDAKRLWDQ